MFQKEIFLLVGLGLVLSLNAWLPSDALIEKELTPKYRFALIPHNDSTDFYIQSILQSIQGEHDVIGGSVHTESEIQGNGDQLDVQFEALTTASIGPNVGTQGTSFGVTINSGGFGWSSGPHCVSFTDGISSFTMTANAASFSVTSITGTLTIPMNANPSALYDMVIFDIGNGSCAGATSSSCVDCFTVLQDSDGDGIADINDNCPNHHNPSQTNNDSDLHGAACDCDDSNPNDDHLVVSGNPIATGFHRGNITLTSAGTVASGSVDFQAPLSVDLATGFQVNLGHVFTITMKGCP